MSDFDDHMETALDHLFTTMGEAITYTAPGGTAASISLAVWRDEVPVLNQGDGEVQEQRPEVAIRSSDLAQPEREAVVSRTKTGETFVVETAHARSGSVWHLVMKRVVRSDGVAGKYRHV